MKQLIGIIPAALLLALCASGCKTNENNYRASYEKIIDKRQAASTAEDSLITGDFYSQGRSRSYDIAGRTLRTRVDYVRPDRLSGHDTVSPLPAIQPFYIVAGQFRQIFNARAQADNLAQRGYEPVIVHNNVPEYFVCINPASTAASALEALDAVEADGKLALRKPCPWVLQPAQTLR